MIPVILVETILYFVSVRHGIERAERINYRMIKVNIETDDQNNEMFSTDDEDYENLKAKFLIILEILLEIVQKNLNFFLFLHLY